MNSALLEKALRIEGEAGGLLVGKRTADTTSAHRADSEVKDQR
jgi:hypothetical protein